MRYIRTGDTVLRKNEGVIFSKKPEEPIQYYERHGNILRTYTTWPDGLQIVSIYEIEASDQLQFEGGVFTGQLPYTDVKLIDSKIINWRHENEND